MIPRSNLWRTTKSRHETCRAIPWIITYESYDYFFRRRVLEWNCIISDHDQNEMHLNCIRIMLPMKTKNQGSPNNQGYPDYQGSPDDNSDVHDHTGRPGSRCWFTFRFYTPVYTLYFILMVPLNTRTFEILRRRCYRRFILVLFKSFEKIIYTKINSQKIKFIIMMSHAALVMLLFWTEGFCGSTNNGKTMEIIESSFSLAFGECSDGVLWPILDMGDFPVFTGHTLNMVHMRKVDI